MRRHHPVVALAALVAPLSAQTSASLEAGGSVIHYETFLRSSAAYVVPTVQFETPGLALGARANYVVFESGNHILQLLLAGGVLQSFGDVVRAELSGSTGLSSYADAPGYGHFLGRARVHVTRSNAGGWVSAGSSHSFLGAQSEGGYELGVGAWLVAGAWSVGARATHAAIAESSYVDLGGTVRGIGSVVELDAAWTVRTDATGVDDGFFADVTVRVPVSPRIAVSVGGGNYPADPLRGALGASYASVGVRVTTRRSGPPLAREMRDVLARAYERDRDGPTVRLVLEEVGAARRVTVVAPGAGAVEIRGDFTDWQPVALTRVDATTFALPWSVAPGVHRLVVRVDGGAWTVPAGARVEEGEFGAAVGVVVVPGR